MAKDLKTALKNVLDPELGVNIVDLGLIYKIEEKAGNVLVLMTLTTPGCPMSPVFEAMIREELQKVKGVKAVRVELTFDPPWNPDMMAAETRAALGF
jgi:metal-sulfur cluster biosynthetic enzyme